MGKPRNGAAKASEKRRAAFGAAIEKLKDAFALDMTKLAMEYSDRFEGLIGQFTGTDMLEEAADVLEYGGAEEWEFAHAREIRRIAADIRKRDTPED